MDDEKNNANVNVNVEPPKQDNVNVEQSEENEYLEYKKNVKPKKIKKPLTHKQKMKMHKKNIKRLPKFLSHRNVKKDLVNQMNSYDSFFKGNKFSMNQIATYSKSIRKLRKNKKSRKHKKIALTNQIQYMNVLFNADRKLNSMSSFNLMKATPQNYIKMFESGDVSTIWKNTSLPYTKTKNSMVKNINSTFHSFLLHNLINDFRKHNRVKKKKQKKKINV